MHEVGCCVDSWDIFHQGHEKFLKECKKKCKILVVGITTDPTIELTEPRRRMEIEKTGFSDKILTVNDLATFLEEQKADCYFYIKDNLSQDVITKYNLKTEQIIASPYISTDLIKQVRREIVQIVISGDEDIVPMQAMIDAFKSYYFYLRICNKQPELIEWDDSILVTYASESSVFKDPKKFKNRQHPLIINQHRPDLFVKTQDLKVDYMCVPTTEWINKNRWDKTNKIVTGGLPTFDKYHKIIQNKPDKTVLYEKYKLDPKKKTVIHNLEKQLKHSQYNIVRLIDQELSELFYLADVLVVEKTDIISQFICFDKPMIAITDKFYDFCIVSSLKNLEMNLEKCLKPESFGDYSQQRRSYMKTYLGGLDGNVCLRTVCEIVKKLIFKRDNKPLEIATEQNRLIIEDERIKSDNEREPLRTESETRSKHSRSSSHVSRRSHESRRKEESRREPSHLQIETEEPKVQQEIPETISPWRCCDQDRIERERRKARYARETKETRETKERATEKTGEEERGESRGRRGSVHGAEKEEHSGFSATEQNDSRRVEETVLRDEEGKQAVL